MVIGSIVFRLLIVLVFFVLVVLNMVFIEFVGVIVQFSFDWISGLLESMVVLRNSSEGTLTSTIVFVLTKQSKDN